VINFPFNIDYRTILEKGAKYVSNFLTNPNLERWWFFIEIVILGICAFLIWLMILMALRSDAFWQIKATLASREDPKKLKK